MLRLQPILQPLLEFRRFVEDGGMLQQMVSHIKHFAHVLSPSDLVSIWIKMTTFLLLLMLLLVWIMLKILVLQREPQTPCTMELVPKDFGLIIGKHPVRRVG